MSPDDPRHGTQAGYVAGCKCEPCVTARRRECKRRQLHHMTTGPILVDTKHAREHIERCQDFGMRYTNFGSTASSRVLYGDGRIYRRTETRILSTHPRPGVNCFPPHGAVRRLRALMALGHMGQAIAPEIGVSPQYVSMMVNESRSTNGVSPKLWKRIARLYDRWSMTPGGSRTTASRAKAKGWVPPLAWDDDAIDDRRARPTYVGGRVPKKKDIDEAVIERVLSGEKLRTTQAEKREILRRWIAEGHSERELCFRMGWRPGRYVGEAA